MTQNMEENNNKSSFWDLIRYVALALLIVIPFRIFIAQPYVVSGSSMDPTFHDADYLIVDQISKRFDEPKRGAVVIIRYPKDTSKFFIKRLIGFPGEKVEIIDGQVSITDKNGNSIKIKEDYIVYKKNENFSITLNEDEYFVMGDNRAGSSDSRVWGPLPEKYIIGEPILRLLPLSKISVWPGNAEF